MLDLKEISYQPQTGERKIIDNLNLKVHENEIILICGNSGSGKTTLLEIISGLTNPQKGKITWKNKILSSRQRRWFCGVVFQFPERYFIGTTIGKELKIGHKSLREKLVKTVIPTTNGGFTLTEVAPSKDAFFESLRAFKPAEA